MTNSESNCYIQAFSLNDDFLMTPNSLWENENLTFRAKGLLGYMLSRPKNWRVHTWQLSQLYKGEERGNGIEGIRSMIKELIDHEYVIYTKFRNEAGQWEHRYMVYPMPFKDFQKMFPERVKPNLVEPVLVKPSILTRTELTRTELKQQQQHHPKKDADLPVLNPVVVSFKNKERKASQPPPEIYNCLKERTDLTLEDKLILMKFPEDRIKTGLLYFEIEPLKTTLIQGLQWHCSQNIPPKPNKKNDLFERCKKVISTHSSKFREVVLTDKSITFIQLLGQGMPIEIKFNDPDAENLIALEFKKGKFVENKK